MATEVILPRVDMDMVEGKIALWYVKNGDAVTKGQVLFEIETDKATMEVDAPTAGTIAGVSGEIGVTMPVGQIVGWILAPGESAPEAAPAGGGAESTVALASPVAVAGPSAEAPEANASERSAVASGQLTRATPLARSLARERGIDLSRLSGSGPRGRILSADVPNPSRSVRDTTLHLHWWQRGNGAPLVLLHGFGADHASWRPLVQLLSPDVPLIGIDLPNHGKSNRLSVASLQDLAEAVLQRLDEEGVETVHLLGHSLGGGIALAAALHAPARVRSLTVLAPAGLGAEINGAFIDGLIAAQTEPELKGVLQMLFHDPSALSGSFLATAFQQLQAPGRREALTELAAALMPRGVQTGSVNTAWSALRAPVKVIWGRSDQIIPATHAADLPGQVALHLLPKVGHLPQVEAVELVAELVRQQLRAGG